MCGTSWKCPGSVLMVQRVHAVAAIVGEEVARLCVHAGSQAGSLA